MHHIWKEGIARDRNVAKSERMPPSHIKELHNDIYAAIAAKRRYLHLQSFFNVFRFNEMHSTCVLFWMEACQHECLGLTYGMMMHMMAVWRSIDTPFNGATKPNKPTNE